MDLIIRDIKQEEEKDGVLVEVSVCHMHTFRMKD